MLSSCVLTTKHVIILILITLTYPVAELCGNMSPIVGSTTSLTFSPSTASRSDPELLKNGFTMKCSSNTFRWKTLHELSIQVFSFETSSYFSVYLSAERPAKSYEVKYFHWSNRQFFSDGHANFFHSSRQGTGREISIQINSTDSHYYCIYRCVGFGITRDGNFRTDFSKRIYYFLHD